ncbi:hypothetical protein HAX54_016207 [Datura stramonium]|uniref:Metallothionein-like protein n=1 Tax=Datura stramonium TaxID=4076 RepID=A0ABS8UJQ7_DATST|nr:hypothetical protein [Datura stramonium]
MCHEEGNRANLESETEKGVQLDLEATNENIVALKKEQSVEAAAVVVVVVMESMRREPVEACGAVGGNKLESGGCGGCGSGGCGGGCGNYCTISSCEIRISTVGTVYDMFHHYECEKK